MPTFSNGDRSLSIAKPTRAEVNQLKAQGFVEVKSTPSAEPKPVNPSK